MRLILLVSVFLLTGCDCGPICESHKLTKQVLSEYKDENTVVTFLEKYSGEGPGSEKFSTFVKWGIKNQTKYLSLMHRDDMSKATRDRIFYAISDMGLSSEYCALYLASEESDHVLTMRNSILGCTSAE